MTEGKSDAVFSDDEARTLAAVLEEIIPPSGDGALPGAGGLVRAGLVAGTLGHLPDLRLPIALGLAAVESAARGRGGGGFAALAREERLEVLNEVGAADGAFLPSLMFLAYTSYYRDDRVLEALGFEPRPPHPKGYEMAPSDLSLLDPVRRRPKLYREC